MRAAAYAVLALLTVFSVSGVLLFARAVQAFPRGQAPSAAHTPVRKRLRTFVTAAHRERALLRPWARVLVELGSAVCGFPGMGWMLSGRVSLGVVLLALGPACVWVLIPMALVLTGGFAASPYAAVRYLPIAAAVSAVLLAVAEWRSGREVVGARRAI